MHIKYGYIKDDDYFVIKVASGFYENPKIGLSSSQGLMLVMNARTGVTEAILLDEGYLTDIRTAAAGACVAKILAPSVVKAIGIFGTGVQARLQLELALPFLKSKCILVYDINKENLKDYMHYFRDSSLEISFANPAEIAKSCNYIITTTPAQIPLLRVGEILPGTHITAVGADTPDKQELDSAIIDKADIIVADSIVQCKTRGEIFHALKDGLIKEDRLSELGKILAGEQAGRSSDMQISIADLTGVAIQDIQIAKAVFLQYKRKLS
ncbi:unnamed protein product, partial [marine sediment metagenome]